MLGTMRDAVCFFRKSRAPAVPPRRPIRKTFHFSGESLNKLVKKLMLVAAMLMLAAGPSFAADAIRIGLMCPLTGKWASEGQDMQQIVSLLELIVEDDAGDPRTASLAAQKLASAGVMAVIGTYGSAVTEASQNIIDEAEIMQIATGSTSVRLTEKGLPLFFRTCPRDDEQGRVASKVIAAKGFKKVAILHDNSSYAKGLAEEAQKGLKDAGVPVVFYDALTPSERDYTAILTKLKAADPDLIFFTGYYPEAGMLLRQKKEMHWDVPMMGGDAANNTDLVKIAGKDAAKGYFFISPPSAHDFDTPEAKDFFSRYKAQYNSLPSSVWSVLAGDAFKVIVAALQAGTDANPEAVAKYLKKDLKEYPGLTGKLGFNEKGDRIGDLYKVYEVDGNGGFVLQK